MRSQKVAIDIDLSGAVRANKKPETIKIRSNSAPAKVQAGQERVWSRLILQDSVIRILRHIMEDELVSFIFDERSSIEYWEHVYNFFPCIEYVLLTTRLHFHCVLVS